MVSCSHWGKEGTDSEEQGTQEYQSPSLLSPRGLWENGREGALAPSWYMGLRGGAPC